MGTRHEDGSAAEKESRSRRILKEGEWACPDPKCAHVNAEFKNTCETCGRQKPRSKSRVGKEIGKEMADKSKGLFAAEDWVCSKCGNVNWARRKTCNVCNAPKLADLEKRTGYGGGFNDRQDIEYIKRDIDEEFDEFGRKRKKKDGQNVIPQSRDIYDTKAPDIMEDREENEEGEIDKYKLGSDGEDQEESDDTDDADLEKYDLTTDPELADIKIEVKRPPPRPVNTESDCSCSCSGGECSCEDSECDKKDMDKASDHVRDKVYKSSRQRDLERSDRERRRRSRSREKEEEKRDRTRDRDRCRESDRRGSRSRERERARERKRSRSRDRKKSRSRSRDKNRERRRSRSWDRRQ